MNNYLRLGGGVEYNNYPETDGMVIPIFIDLRLNFPVNTSPIFFAELGYNLTQGDGLPFVNIGTGVEIGVSKRTSISVLIPALFLSRAVLRQMVICIFVVSLRRLFYQLTAEPLLSPGVLSVKQMIIISPPQIKSLLQTALPG